MPRKKKRKSFALPRFLDAIPQPVQHFIASRLIDGMAFMHVGLGVIMAVAMISYSQNDPSANTGVATNDKIANWLGQPGAWLADILLQTLGYAAFLPAIALLIWGVHLFRRKKMRSTFLRFPALIIAMICAAIAFARIPSGSLLPQPYLGGSSGMLILDYIAAILQPVLSGWDHTIIALCAIIPTLILFSYATGITRKHWGFAVKQGLSGIGFILSSLYAGFLTIKDWVSDQDADARQARQSKSKPIKIKAERKAPSLDGKAAEPPSKDTNDAPSNALSAAIKVVTPGKSTSAASKSGGTQGRFALGTDAEGWELPPIELLQDAPAEVVDTRLDEGALRKNAEMLQNVLADFNVQGEITSIHPGPVVTLYELEPSPGTKTSRVISLSDDIARSMAAISVRAAVVPGRNVIGIELPNSTRQTVYLREVLTSRTYEKAPGKLPLVLGKDIGGQPVIADLARMPHLLVAGTTGSGKSVAVNTMILSLLYRFAPEQVRMIMIDPKMLELSVYDDIPHLLSPVVTEPGQAVVALKWAVAEMEERYRAMSKLGVRNIEGYNERLREARKKGETLMRKVQTGFDADTGKPVYEDQPLDLTELPYIVIIVDEFADLMLVAGKDVEGAVQRLAQMARAAGIHLIMATQRPSVDVITGVVKANFPTRISFQVTSKIDSRTILGEGGAEQLLGMGDMLYMASGGRIRRVHGPFVSDNEVEDVVSHLKRQAEPAYLEDITSGNIGGDSEVMGALFGDSSGSSDVDALYDEAVMIVARDRKASTSYIQRQLQIGYNRAARIIEEMEKQGVISTANHVGKREVLVSDHSHG